MLVFSCFFGLKSNASNFIDTLFYNGNMNVETRNVFPYLKGPNLLTIGAFDLLKDFISLLDKLRGHMTTLGQVM